MEAMELPEEMKMRVRRAAELCGITELRKCADELEAGAHRAPLLARCIRGYLQSYDTTPIVQLLERARSVADSAAPIEAGVV